MYNLGPAWNTSCEKQLGPPAYKESKKAKISEATEYSGDHSDDQIVFSVKTLNWPLGLWVTSLKVCK